MEMDAFTVVAELIRRRILDRLAVGERSVGQLVEGLGVSQPVVSKHLRVLREAGFVSCRVAAQQRIYRLELGRFRELDRWMGRYRKLLER